MKRYVICFLLLITNSLNVAMAQEGFPLDGTWRGQWGGGDGEATMAVITMDWDGESISGRINPGRNMVLFEGATLDPIAWLVHIEATAKTGEPIIIEGVLANIGSYQRTITGTWNIDGVENQMVLTRE